MVIKPKVKKSSTPKDKAEIIEHDNYTIYHMNINHDCGNTECQKSTKNCINLNNLVFALCDDCLKNFDIGKEMNIMKLVITKKDVTWMNWYSSADNLDEDF